PAWIGNTSSWFLHRFRRRPRRTYLVQEGASRSVSGGALMIVIKVIEEEIELTVPTGDLITQPVRGDAPEGAAVSPQQPVVPPVDPGDVKVHHLGREGEGAEHLALGPGSSHETKHPHLSEDIRCHETSALNIQDKLVLARERPHQYPRS